MVSVSPESLVALRDATELAFYGVEFETLTPRDEEDSFDGLLSGSDRIKDVYDSSRGQFVSLIEIHALAKYAQNAPVVADHRLIAEWDDGLIHEVELEDGEIILDMGQEEVDPEVVKSKIINALSAATSIA